MLCPHAVRGVGVYTEGRVRIRPTAGPGLGVDGDGAAGGSATEPTAPSASAGPANPMASAASALDTTVAKLIFFT